VCPMAEGELPGLVCVVVNPKGSRNSYVHDPALGGITFKRRLASAEMSPADCGFLRGTLAADGKPLQALVCVHQPTFPGCLVAVNALGLLKTHAHGDRNDDVVVCIPAGDPRWTANREVDDLPSQLRAEIELLYRQSPGFAGWGSRAEAVREIARARQRARTESAEL